MCIQRECWRHGLWSWRHGPWCSNRLPGHDVIIRDHCFFRKIASVQMNGWINFVFKGTADVTVSDGKTVYPNYDVMVGEHFFYLLKSQITCFVMTGKLMCLFKMCDFNPIREKSSFLIFIISEGLILGNESVSSTSSRYRFVNYITQEITRIRINLS